MRLVALGVAVVACNRPPHRDLGPARFELDGVGSGVDAVERALVAMPELSRVRTTIRDGHASIDVEAGSGADISRLRAAAGSGWTVARVPRFARYVVTVPGMAPLPLGEVADELVDKVDAMPGVHAIMRCGEMRERGEIELASEQMTAAGVTVDDVSAALASVPRIDPHHLRDLVIARPNGVAITLADVATSSSHGDWSGCIALARSGYAVVVDVEAANDVGSAALASIPLRPQPAASTIVVGLTDDDRMDGPRIAAALRDAVVGATPGSDDLLVQLHDDVASVDVVADAPAADSASAALRALPFVVGAGVPGAVIELSGADREAVGTAARGLAAQLAARHQLIAVVGAATRPAPHVVIDNGAASRLGAVDPSSAAGIVGGGLRLAAVQPSGRAVDVVVHGSLQVPVRVRDGSAPFDAIAQLRAEMSPTTIVRERSKPAVLIYVRGSIADAQQAIADAKLDRAVATSVDAP